MYRFPDRRTTVSFIKLYFPSGVICGAHLFSIGKAVPCSSGSDLADNCRDICDLRFDSFLDGIRTGGSVSLNGEGYLLNDLTEEPVDNFLEGVRTGSSVSLSCEGYFVNDLIDPVDSFLDGFRTGGSVSVSCDGYFVNDLTDPCDTPEPCLAIDSDGVDFKESF